MNNVPNLTFLIMYNLFDRLDYGWWPIILIIDDPASGFALILDIALYAYDDVYLFEQSFLLFCFYCTSTLFQGPTWWWY